MSVIYPIRLIGEKRFGSKTSLFVATYKRFWRIQTNDTLDDPAIVLAATGLGTVAQTTYSSGNGSDPLALLISQEANEEAGNFKSWIVTEEFSTVPLGNQNQLNSNPLLDLVKYSGGFDAYQRVARTDNSGAPILNSRKEAFRDPPIVVDDQRPILRAVRNEAFIDWSLIGDLSNTVNKYPWKNWPARCWKVKGIIPGEIQIRNSIQYYAVNYEFHLNRDTWDYKILNLCRSYVKNDATRVYLKSTDDAVVVDTRDNSKVDPDVKTTPPEFQYVTSKILEERDFSIFNL